MSSDVGLQALSLFHGLDRDQDNRLGAADIRRFTRSCFCPEAQADPERGLRNASGDSQPCVDFLELLDLIRERNLLRSYPETGQLQHLLRRLGRGGGDGPALDCAALADKMTAAGYPVRDRELRALLRAVDGSDCGSVTADRLCSLFLRTYSLLEA